jgi:trehalose/maltose hydrolase-like predicted phosphorylase
VFWDADVFVLPALCTIDPPAAGAMVDYRLNRLSAAREGAKAEGRDGARFPWESAHDGRDVTPESGYVGGERVPILTGTLEEHITADVAWAAVHHATWTRPASRLTKDESLLLRDTARYWASRVTTDEDGSAHIRGVIGPDEYHERVDDNAFTNAMARWNLRTAAHLAPVKEAERAAWSSLAEALADGYDATTGLYEQFQGYFDLQPLLVREIAEPPVAADVLAGRDVIARSQLIKQPDALMIHHLLPEDAVPGSLRHNLDFYAPRTAHGSSLSPAVMALLHARAGQPDTALDLLRLSLRIDLGDLGGTTSAGVHIGACGGAWQAVVSGFLGARVSRGRLHLDPVLPSRWPELEVRFRCLGRDVQVRVDHDLLTVDASAPLTVSLSPDCRYQTRTSTEVRFVPGGLP